MIMLKVGLAQTHNHFEVEKNLQDILRSLNILADQEVDIALFPECALTGYNTRLLNINKQQVLAAVESVQSLCRERNIAVALPTPWPKELEGFYNSVLYISNNGELRGEVHKMGLQKGEEKLFVSAGEHRRVFEIKGYRMGIVICVETSHKAWSYLKQIDEADFIFWPGFYASTPEELQKDWNQSENASDQKVRENLIKDWQVPLLHVNCASSPEAQYWPGKLFGGSSVFGKDGATLFAGRRAEEQLIVVELNQGTVVSVK